MAAEIKNVDPFAAKFAESMGNVEVDTILKINEISREFNVDPFKAVELFGNQLIKVAEKMRADYEKQNEASDTEPAENVVNDHQSEV